MIGQVLLGRTVPAVGGEFVALSSGSSGSWVCPAGVTSVCAVVIGAGGVGGVTSAGTIITAGGGGALAYKNNIAVTPGTSYPYTFGTATAVFGMTANNGKDGWQGGDGGTATGGAANFSGERGGDSDSYSDGGNAATYTANGAAIDGRGTLLDGTAALPKYGGYGYGGNVTSGSNAIAPGLGALRIIWGAGRSFPGNAI